MSISAISGNSQTQSSLLQNLIQQSQIQFQQLGQDLQAGNVSAAQQDFTQLTSSATSSTSANSSNSPLNSLLSGSSGSANSTAALQSNRDLTSLASGLQAGNLSAAQKAYSSLKQDLQNPSSSSSSQVHHHHHHGGSNFQNPAPASSSGSSPSNNSSGLNLSSLFSNISALPLASLSLAA